MAPLSEKYLASLAARNAARDARGDNASDATKLVRRITTDQPCWNCGYNRRGLIEGRACPECGAGADSAGGADGGRDAAGGAGTPATGRARFAAPPDPLLTLPAADRVRRGQAARIAGIGCLVAVFAAWFVLVQRIFGVGTSAAMLADPLVNVSLLRCAATATWAVAAWMTLTPGIWRSAGWAPLGLRPVVLGVMIAWPVCSLGPLVAAEMTTGPVRLVEGLSFLGRMAGAVATAVALVVLSSVCLLAECNDASERFKTAAFVTVPVGGFWLLGSVEMPATIVFGMIVLVLIPWSILMWKAMLALFELSEHLRWSVAVAEQAAGRADRVAEKRAALERQASATVRDLPTGKPVRRMRADDAVCRACGYALRGTRAGARCPECGDEGLG
ncbi:MAG: hypothetical protein AB8G96_07485 [Phycisphaerales bacterium]